MAREREEVREKAEKQKKRNKKKPEHIHQKREKSQHNNRSKSIGMLLFCEHVDGNVNGSSVPVATVAATATLNGDSAA